VTIVVGDVLTIAGLYDDGTCERNETPPDRYSTTKAEQIWRVRYIGPDGINLQPLNQDGSVQEFNDAYGDFWIRPDGYTKP
jgi:hypothetical protein